MVFRIGVNLFLAFLDKVSFFICQLSFICYLFAGYYLFVLFVLIENYIYAEVIKLIMPGQQPTEEELKNMSPEEIREFSKRQCIFCQIINGRVSSKRVYEDDKCIAILDINPGNPGHTLLIPREHYSLMPMVPDDIVSHLGQTAKHMSQALLKALKVQGTYIFAANGVAAGQKSQHFMIHIIPRQEGDGLLLDIPQNAVQEQQLEQVRSALIAKAGEVQNAGGLKTEKLGEKKGELGIKKEGAKPAGMGLTGLEGSENLQQRQQPVGIKAGFGAGAGHAADSKIKIMESKRNGLDLDAIAELVAGAALEKPSSLKGKGNIIKKTGYEKNNYGKYGFVSSTTSEKYHAVNCPFAKRIGAEKIVYFKNEQDAKRHKKKPCSCVS